MWFVRNPESNFSIICLLLPVYVELRESSGDPGAVRSLIVTV